MDGQVFVKYDKKTASDAHTGRRTQAHAMRSPALLNS